MCQLSSLKAIGKVAQASSLLDNKNFEAAKNALSGLSTKAAVSASSFLKFTEAQTAALLKSTGFSAEMVATELATQGAGKAITATALAEAGYSKEAIPAALATATFRTSEESTIIATNTFGASLKNLGKGLKAFLTSTPLGWITIAAATIYGAVKIFNKINETQDRAIERANQAQQEYENVQSEIASLESQLESINSQIAEINSSGPLSFTDREQLALLEAQRKELEQQIELKQKIAEYKGAEAANEAEKALTTQKSEKEKVGVNSHSAMASNLGYWTALDPIDKAENLYDRVQEVTERRNRHIEDTIKRWDTMSDSERKWAQKITAGYDKDIAWLQTELGDKLELIDEQRSKLVDDTGAALIGHENTVARIDALYDKVITKADEAGQAAASSAEPPLAMSQNTREKYNQISAANDRTKPGVARASAIAAARKEYEDALAADLAATSFTVDIEAEAKGFDAVQSALKASTEAAGLSSEAVATLTARYQNLDSFNPEALFQRTANGVRLDTDEVAKLESELQGATQTGFDDQLRVWTEQLDDVNRQLENSNNLSADEIAKLIASRGALVQKITGAKELATQYAALTSNYQQWLDAQSAGEEGDMYDNIVKGYDKAKELFDKGLTGTNEFREYVELVSGKDLSSASIKEITDEWDRLNKVSSSTGFAPLDYLSDGSAGVENFISAVQKVESEWVSFDEKTKTWSINVESVDELASKLGVDSELVEALLKKAGDYGVTVSTQVQDSFGNAITSIEDAMSTLQSQLESRGIKIDLETTDIETATTQMDDFYEYYKTLLDKNGKIKLDTAEAQAAYTIMSSLWDLWTQLSTKDSVVYNIDSSSITEASSAADKFVGALDGVIEAKQELAKRQALGLDTSEAEQNLQDAITNLNTLYGKLDDDEKGKLKLKLDKGEITKENIDSIISQLDAKPECLVDLKVSKGILPADMTPEGDTTEVNLKIGKNAVADWIKEGGKETDVSIKPLLTAYNTWLGTTDTKNVRVVETRIRKGDGPVPINQFQGTAHAGGQWGAKRDEYALTGELGEEIVVSPQTGRWQTVGANGAEFAHIPKGAIVFNHKQTEQLLKYGHINSRGRALASGTAYAGKVKKPNVKFTGFTELNDSARGTTVIGNKPLQAVAKAAETASKTVTDTARAVTTNTKTATTASEEAADTIKDEASGLTDWVEKVLENIDKKTEKYIAKAEKKAEAGNYSGAARQYQKALNTYDKSIGKHGDAENLYMRQANSALSKAISSGTITKEMAATIQKRVANGAMDISKLSDGTKAVVDAYKEYYDKAVAAADATMELYDKYEETAKKMYQLPLDQASAKTDKLQNSYDLLEKKVEATTSLRRKESLLEQQLSNVQAQHIAVVKSATLAEKNYAKARDRVDSTSDAALSGLSADMKAKVTAKVAEGLVIDVTALTGLTSEGKQAIIDYNAALVAQQDAYNNLQTSALDTAASIKELAAEIANLPNEKADAKIEKMQPRDEELAAVLGISGSSVDSDIILKKQTGSAKRKYNIRRNATVTARRNVTDAWNDDLIQQIAASQGKSQGEKLSKQGYKKKSDEYKAIEQYNAYIDAFETASHNEVMAWTEYVKTKQDNTSAMFENFKAQNEHTIEVFTKAAEDSDKALEDVDKAALDLMAKNPNMTYTEAVAEVYRTAEANFKQASDDYLKFAQALQDWLDAHKGDMSAEDVKAHQDVIDGIREQGENYLDKSVNANNLYTDYNNQTASRERDNAQRAYDEIHQKNELTRASGYSVSLEDAEAEEQALTNLIAKNTELIAKMKKLRDAQTIGSDKWKEYQSAMDDATNQNVSLYGSLDEVKDGIRDIKLKPITKQLQKLDNEQQKVQDHMDYMKNIGMQPLVSDYMKLVDISKQRQTELQNEKAKLLEEQATLDPLSQRYQEIEQEVADIDHQIQQCTNDQAAWKQEAMNTVVGAVQSVGNAASGMAGAISSVANTVSKIIGDIIGDMRDFRQMQLNKIYMAITKIDTKLGLIQHDMKIRETLGQRTTADDYVQQALLLAEKLTKQETDVIPRLQTEYNIQKNHRYSHNENDPLADPDGSKTKAAYEAWQNAVLEAKSIDEELTELLANGISSALLEPLAEAKEYISDIAGLLDNISGLITDDMLLDEAGKFTQHGEQKLAILAGQYRTVQQEVQATKNEIYGLSAALASGQKLPESFMGDYVAKWTELTEIAEDQKQLAIEMVDAMREASEAELDSLKDIIDARREALQAKKDYYDYDKTIRGKTKDIQALQAQIAAIEGLTDAESKAKRARLEAELNAAQEDLDDTIQQHMFELSDDALSKLGDALDKAHAEEWDKVVNSVDALLKYAAEFSNQYSDSQVSDSIEQLLRSYGIITSETSEADITLLTTLFRKTLADVNSGDYNQTEFQNAIDNYNSAIDALQNKGLITNVAKIATSNEEMVQAVNDAIDNSDTHQTSIDNKGARSTVDLLKAILAGNSVNGEQGGEPNLLGQLAIFPQGFMAEAAMWFANSKLDNLFGGHDHLVDVANSNAQKAIDTLEKLKDVKIGNWRVFGNYASGSRRVGKDQLAWTQEHGKEEWIVRPSDGAILTPLSSDSGVLPPDITSKLWALAEGKMPTMQMPKMPTPTYDFSETISPVVNIDNSMTVEGSVDAAVIDDLKKFKDEQREDIYQYVSDRMFRGYIHSGGKRRI